MPVTITKTVSIKDKEGNISILTETDQIAESTDISAICDSSRCASRHEGKPAEIAWNIEAVKEKAEALPDSFFRLLSLVINPRSQEQKVFCSAGCVRDFLQYDYVAPLSPREEAVLQANNQQAELAKHRPKTNIIQFPGKSAPETPRALNPAGLVPPRTSEIGPEELGASPVMKGPVSEAEAKYYTQPAALQDFYADAPEPHYQADGSRVPEFLPREGA